MTVTGRGAVAGMEDLRTVAMEYQRSLTENLDQFYVVETSETRIRYLHCHRDFMIAGRVRTVPQEDEPNG